MSNLENLDATTVLFQKLERHIDILYYFLLSCGITPKDRKISTLTELLKDIKVLKPKINYVAYATDSYGYITDAIEMKTFTGVDDVPKDITRGYYKVDKQGNIILDAARKSIIWGD
jgi:hypothetical protein